MDLLLHWPLDAVGIEFVDILEAFLLVPTLFILLAQQLLEPVLFHLWPYFDRILEQIEWCYEIGEVIVEVTHTLLNGLISHPNDDFWVEFGPDITLAIHSGIATVYNFWKFVSLLLVVVAIGLPCSLCVLFLLACAVYASCFVLTCLVVVHLRLDVAPLMAFYCAVIVVSALTRQHTEREMTSKKSKKRAAKKLQDLSEQNEQQNEQQAPTQHTAKQEDCLPALHPESKADNPRKGRTADARNPLGPLFYKFHDPVLNTLEGQKARHLRYQSEIFKLFSACSGLRFGCAWTRHRTPTGIWAISKTGPMEVGPSRFPTVKIRGEAMRRSYDKPTQAGVQLHIALKCEEQAAVKMLTSLLDPNNFECSVKARFFQHPIVKDLYYVMFYVRFFDGMWSKYIFDFAPAEGTRIGIKVCSWDACKPKNGAPPNSPTSGFDEKTDSFFSGEMLDNIWEVQRTLNIYPTQRLFAGVRAVNIPEFDVEKRYLVDVFILDEKHSPIPTVRQVRAVNDCILLAQRTQGLKIPLLILNAESIFNVDTSYFSSSMTNDQRVLFLSAVSYFDLSVKQLGLVKVAITSTTGLLAFTHKEPSEVSKLLAAMALGYAVAGQRVLFVSPTMSRLHRGIDYFLDPKHGGDWLEKWGLNAMRFQGSPYLKHEQNLYSNCPNHPQNLEWTDPERNDSIAAQEMYTLPEEMAEREKAAHCSKYGQYTRLLEAMEQSAKDPTDSVHGPAKIALSAIEKLKIPGLPRETRAKLRRLLGMNEACIRDRMLACDTNIVFTTCALSSHPAIDMFKADVIIMHDRGQYTVGTSAIPFAANSDSVKMAVIGGDVREKPPMLFSYGQNEWWRWITQSLLKKVIGDSRWDTFDLDKM